MLELTMTKIKQDSTNYAEVWFVDSVERGLRGICYSNLFNSKSKDECIKFMRSYRNGL